ncbi:MAG: hypothetical protein H6729_02430 [Deltaproteobacteria bacterium]|nr:hypothetical protein [Deltaproteobacteria bacterium]
MFQINATESAKVEVTPVVSVECFGVSTHARCGHDEERVQYLISDVVHSMFVQQTSLTFREQTGLVGGSRGKLLAMTGMERAPGSDSSASASASASSSVVGSGSNGRVLAQLAEGVGMLTPRFLRESTTADLEDAVQTALHAAATGNQDEDADQQTMLSAAYVLWPELHVMSFGRGSVYLLRGGVLGRLTGDRARPRTDGARTEKGKGSGGGAIEVGYARGGPSDVPVPGSLFNRDHRVQSHPEIRRERLKADDAIVLCSHALTRTLDEARIATIVRSAVSPEAACRGLVEAAKIAGCVDPITVLVAHCRPS